jgi:RimJ/RimL family protein N-acetyltransferase
MDRRVIQTERLDLISFTPAFLRASLRRDRAEAERLLGVPLPADWPGDCERMLSLRLAQLEADAALQPWLVRAMVLRGERVMVGHIGFHTAPNPDYLLPYSPGAVEFGFSVDEPYRRRGYAREASLALMRWAHDSHGVAKFIMSISPENVASQSLAAGLGFVRIGSHIDEVDGLEEILEYRVGNG